MNLYIPLVGLVSLSFEKSILVVFAILAVAGTDIVRRVKHKPTHLFFATLVGSCLSLGLIRTVALLVQPGSQENPYLMAMMLVLVVLGWKTLFGPWEVQTKLTVLATFLFWICLALFSKDTAMQNSVRAIAALTALIPAAIWCVLFLKYHHERLQSVFLLFLAGCVSTVPILFYDFLVRRGIEMQFFLVRVKFESFSGVAQSFVMDHAGDADRLIVVLLTTLLSFFFVALIEEVSKYWVLTRSAGQIFSSIDDVLQLSIVVAIGFAFAENVINPVYFTAFVREYLFINSPDIGGFLSNVLGRSVLTSMVHIVSTGVMGYFLGLAIFADPYLVERHAKGKTYRILAFLRRTLRVKEVSIFRVNMLVMGLVSAVALHALFNFLVTLPEILPGNPDTLGDLLGPTLPSLLAHIPLLLVPALFYVVGGFWLLTTLFLRETSMEQRGHVVFKEELVSIMEE